MAARKRRHGPKHPGVVLVEPNAERRTGWRVRYTNPDTGKVKWETLEAVLTTAERRAAWAVQKSKKLAERRLELEGGAHPETGTTLTDAVKTYFDDHPTLRDATLEVYRAAAAKLTTWAAKNGVHSGDDLTAPKLVAFRAALVREPLLGHVKGKGSKRGTMKATEKPRSPHTINRELRSVGTVLTYLRKRGLLPKMSSDDLTDALAKLRTTTDPVDYLKPAELQRLLEAALRHDSETFDATRVEHSANIKNKTPRYDPIAPFVAFLVLTGMRLNEGIDIDWEAVDLDALDNDRRKVGEITLSGGATKTHRGRIVALEVSPALRTMLASLKLRSGGKGSVFGITEGQAVAAALRLQRDYGAPKGTNWQALRGSCGSYLTNAPGIFGNASAYHSARQLGHSVQVAERHYVGRIRGIPREARDLETAMQITTQMERVIAAVGARPARPKALKAS